MARIPSRSFICPVLIGRSAQMDVISRALLEVAEGQQRAVLLSGEAGIGKTRLATEVIERAEAQGFDVLRGECFERGHSVPFSAFLELLRGYFASSEPEQVAQDLGSAAREIAKLVPELVSMVPGLTPAPLSEGEEEKRRLFHALAQFLGRLASRQPVIVLIEDLHWADETTLEFLLFLCRSSTARLMLLMTCRSDEGTPDLVHFLAQLDRQRFAMELSLTPLTMAETDVMVRSILDMRRPVNRDYLEALHSVTSGNPFFVEEVVKSSVSRVTDDNPDPGRHVLAADAEDLQRVPRTVQDAVRQRTAHLGSDTRRLLDLASACGMRFDLELCQEIRHQDAEAMLPQIKELLAAQLIVEEQGDSFSFRHALTRQAVYSQLLGIERRSLHRQIGDALEAIASRVPGQTEQRAGEVAYHFYEAEVWDKALGYSDLAAEQASRLSTPRAVIQHLNRSLEAARRLSLPPSARRLRLLASACEIAGDFDRALTNMQAAYDAASSDDEQSEQWQALIGLGVIWSVRDYERTGEYWRSALELARTMDDRGLIGHSLNRVGNWHLNIEQPVESVQHHEEALEIFEKIEDPDGIAETVDLLGMAWYLGGDMVRSRAYYERSLRLTEHDRSSFVYGSSLATVSACSPVYHTDTLAPSVTLDEGVAWLDQVLQLAVESGWRAGETYALICSSICLGPMGEYGRALDVAKRGLAIAEDMGHMTWASSALWATGCIQMDLLDHTAARRSLERALALARDTGSLHWTRVSAGALARCLIAEGDADAAKVMLDATLNREDAFRTLGQRVIATARIELALTTGDASRALQLVTSLIETAGGDGQAPPPRLGLLRGGALLMLDDRQGAEAAYREAAELARRLGQRGLAWRAHAALAHAYRSWGRRTEAREQRALAEAVIADLVLSLDDADARASFQDAALATLPPAPQLSPNRAAKEAFEGLTEREREVAALIAAGRSNPEIAAELVVSVRTVESHVSNILATLGFSSRAQIAAWAAERGLKSR